LRLMRNSWWLVCLAVLAGCGGDGPTPPTAPGRFGVTSITVTGSDLLLVGASETFTAAGDTRVITAPRWGSDAPGVATVDPATGRVTAVGTGTATIFVDAYGIRGTKLVRTLPNFGGEGVASFECGNRQTSNNQLSLTLTQDREVISGGLKLYDDILFGHVASNDLSGSVSSDGILSFIATAKDPWVGGQGVVRIENVRIGWYFDRVDRMAGTFELVWFYNNSRDFCKLEGGNRVSPR